MLRIKFLVHIVVFAVIISCAAGRKPQNNVQMLSPQAKFEAQVKEVEASNRAREMNERILMSSLSSRKDPKRDYKLGPEDLIEVSVYEDDKLKKTARVSSQGNISLPLLGVLRVQGLTANQLEKEIRDLLQEKYFQDPHVSVFIKEYRSQRISVIGAVLKPGVYEAAGEKTILDLISMAGGLRDDAGHLLFLIRPPDHEESSKEKKKGEVGEAEDNKAQTFLVDLDELVGKGDLALNMPLKNGDVIRVPVSGKVFVGGEVKNPGGIDLAGKRLTVSQAILLAGGFTPKADGSETKVIRYMGKAKEKEILSIDVYAVDKGQMEDVYLKENDILLVPKSGTKSFFIELWDFVKGRVGTVGLGSVW